MKNIELSFIGALLIIALYIISYGAFIVLATSVVFYTWRFLNGGC